MIYSIVLWYIRWFINYLLFNYLLFNYSLYNYILCNYILYNYLLVVSKEPGDEAAVEENS